MTDRGMREELQDGTTPGDSAESGIDVVLVTGLSGAGRGIDTLLRNTVVARLYGPRRFASIQGVLGLIITLALAAGPVGLGFVYDRFGQYDPGLWFVAFTSVVAVVAVSWGTRTGQPASER